MPKIDVSVIVLSGATLALLGIAGPVGALAMLALGLAALAFTNRQGEPRALRVRADRVPPHPSPRPAPRRLP